jgi:hypothetical protein
MALRFSLWGQNAICFALGFALFEHSVFVITLKKPSNFPMVGLDYDQEQQHM